MGDGRYHRSLSDFDPPTNHAKHTSKLCFVDIFVAQPHPSYDVPRLFLRLGTFWTQPLWKFTRSPTLGRFLGTPLSFRTLGELHASFTLPHSFKGPHTRSLKGAAVRGRRGATGGTCIGRQGGVRGGVGVEGWGDQGAWGTKDWATLWGRGLVGTLRHFAGSAFEPRPSPIPRAPPPSHWDVCRKTGPPGGPPLLGSRGWGVESKRRWAESQWIVAARPLCHLQYPVAYLSRLQRILPAARKELRFKAARAAHPARGPSQRHVPLGALPLPRVGNRAARARIASSPDSDLEAFSHNPAHGSFAPLAFQPSAMTNCANQRFLSY